MDLWPQIHALWLTCRALYWPGTFQESCPILDRLVYFPSLMAQIWCFLEWNVDSERKAGPVAENTRRMQLLVRWYQILSSKWGSSWFSKFFIWVVCTRPLCEHFSALNLVLGSLFSCESGNGGRLPEGFCKLQQASCIELAACYLWIQRNF